MDFIDDFCFIEFDGNYDLLISEKNSEDGKIHTIKYPNNQDGHDTIELKRKSGKTVIIYATLQDLSGRSEKLTKNDDVLSQDEEDNSINKLFVHNILIPLEDFDSEETNSGSTSTSTSIKGGN